MSISIQGNTRRHTFDSLANLRLLSGEGLTDNETADVSGHTTEGDSGGGGFFWDASSTATDDNGTIVKLADTTTGRFIRTDQSSISVNMFGAVGDGVADDTVMINLAITYANLNNGGIVRLGNSHLITGPILMKTGVILQGDGRTLITATGTGYNAIDCTGTATITSRFQLRDFRIIYTTPQTAIAGSGVLLSSASVITSNYKIFNISVSNGYHNFYNPSTGSTFLGEFDLCTSQDSDNYGFYIHGVSNTTLSFKQCYSLQSDFLRTSGRALYMQACSGLVIESFAADRANKIAFQFQNCSGVIGLLRCEVCDATTAAGSANAWLRVFDSDLEIDMLLLADNTVAIPSTGNFSAVYTDNARCRISTIVDFSTAATITSTGVYLTITTDDTSDIIYNEIVSYTADGSLPTGIPATSESIGGGATRRIKSFNGQRSTTSFGPTTLANDATPTVLGIDIAITGGTTTITDFDDGVVGQTIRLLSAHAVTITDGTNILLNGSANFVMAAGDTLVLTMFNDQVWEETGRKVNL